MGADHSIPKSTPVSSEGSQRSSRRISKPMKVNSNLPSAELGIPKSSRSSSIFKKRIPLSLQKTNIPKAIKTHRTIFIEAEDNVKVQVDFPIEEQDNLTCEWLTSEAINKLAQNNLLNLDPKHPIIALQTIDNSITLDYWLSCSGRSLSVLKEGTVLKPFYGDNAYKLENQKISLDYFHNIKLIGAGGFSKVYLVRRKDNGQFYALKVISKEGMTDQELESVKYERDILVKLSHPFLAKLHFAFQTTGQLFFVMDFFPGGELFYNLQQKKKLTETEAKIYFGEIILALNYLHKNNIIYRDLKPENILLDIDGHLHLTDFGLCKPVRDKNELNYTFCGSPEYLAPEVLNGTGYSFPVDYYGLGILLYEMVVGQTPFCNSKSKDLSNKILNAKVSYPRGLSADLKSFLSVLLKSDPSQRLGTKGGFIEIINHPWCKNINFSQITSKKGKAPIQPDLCNPNFNKWFLEREITLEEENPIDIPEESEEKLRKMCTIEEQLVSKNVFEDFSFYSNFQTPSKKFSDSAYSIGKDTEEGEELCFNKQPNFLSLSNENFKETKQSLSEEIPSLQKNVLKQSDQENYVDNTPEEPLSSQKIPLYQTMPLKSIDNFSSSSFLAFIKSRTVGPSHELSKLGCKRNFTFDIFPIVGKGQGQTPTSILTQIPLTGSPETTKSNEQHSLINKKSFSKYIMEESCKCSS